MISSAGDMPQVLNLPDFWSRLSACRTRLLALDYDGTLAPFRLERLKAWPLPGVRAALRALSKRKDTRVVIVSGRPLAQLVQLLDLKEVILIGSHGREIRYADGRTVLFPPEDNQQRGLARARELADQQGWEQILETKIASLALHTRGLTPELALETEKLILSSWRRIALEHDLEWLHFNGGVEIRARGRHKGDALEEILAAQPPGTLSVYVGDDETDEDAFRRLAGRGIGIRVGDPGIATAASGFLRNCQEVRTFIEAWLSLPAACQAAG